MRKHHVLVLLLVLLVFGCAGNHCISVGGEYKGVEGALQYCFDKADSEKKGIPVLSEKSPEGTKKMYALDSDQVKKINSLMDEKGPKKASHSAGRHEPITELLEKIREK